MSKALKQQMALELQNSLKETDSFILFNYNKLKSQQAYDLRRFLFEKNVRVKVLKNSIASLVFSENFSKDLCKFLKGPTAICYTKGSGGVVNASKVLLEWNKKAKILEIKAGYLLGKTLNEKELEVISKLPSRETLLAMIAGLFKSPLQQVATVLSAPMQNFTYAMNDVMKQKEAAEKK